MVGGMCGVSRRADRIGFGDGDGRRQTFAGLDADAQTSCACVRPEVVEISSGSAQVPVAAASTGGVFQRRCREAAKDASSFAAVPRFYPRSSTPNDARESGDGMVP